MVRIVERRVGYYYYYFIVLHPVCKPFSKIFFTILTDNRQTSHFKQSHMYSHQPIQILKHVNMRSQRRFQLCLVTAACNALQFRGQVIRYSVNRRV